MPTTPLHYARTRHVWLVLLMVTGCQDAAPAKRPAPVEKPAPEPPPPPAPAPPPDFDGNWYVLKPDQTLEQFADEIGVPAEVVRTRARQVDYRWFEAMKDDIERRFPQVKDAFGGEVRLPRAGYSDQVEEGEDLWALVKRFKVSAVELLVVNGLGPDDAEKIKPGMRIVVPGIVRTIKGKMVRMPHPKEEEALARARELDLGKAGTASRLLFGHMEDRWMEAAGGTDFNGVLAWPVSGGWFVRGYGSGEAGYHLAVDVAAPIGWPVRSSNAGIVAYVGDGIRGYGNVVMIIHPGGFVTFYAHLSAAFVYSGMLVEQGEIIAEVGSTGISRGPHVHYEFVHQGRNCDPTPLFRTGVRNRDGTYKDIPQLKWTGADPPKGLKCEPRPRHHPSSRWVVNEKSTAEEAPAKAAPKSP